MIEPLILQGFENQPGSFFAISERYLDFSATSHWRLNKSSEDKADLIEEKSAIAPAIERTDRVLFSDIFPILPALLTEANCDPQPLG